VDVEGVAEEAAVIKVIEVAEAVVDTTTEAVVVEVTTKEVVVTGMC